MTASTSFEPVGRHLRLEYGKALPEADRVEAGGYPAYGANGSKIRSRKYLRDKPSILVGRKGSAGEVTLSEAKFWPLDVTYFVEFDRLRHDLRYLFHLLRWLDIPTLSKGVKPGINRDDVYGLAAPFPPLAEQQSIAAALDEALEGVASAVLHSEVNLANAVDLQRSCLEMELALAANGRTTIPLSSLCATGRPITYGVVKLGDPVIGGTPCLRTSNVRWLAIEELGLKSIDPALSAEYRRTILRGGEVLVNVRGTLGGVAVVPPEMAGWNISREVAIVPNDPERTSSEFLALWIASQSSQEWLTTVTTGAAYVGINIADLRNLPIPRLSIAEQEAVVVRVHRIMREQSNLIRNYQRKLTLLAELKQSLLGRAFSGELTREPIAA